MEEVGGSKGHCPPTFPLPTYFLSTESLYLPKYSDILTRTVSVNMVIEVQLRAKHNAFVPFFSFYLMV